MNRFRRLGLWMPALAGLTFGCATSSHKTVHMYEYNDDPRAQRTGQPVQEEEEDESEWRMVPPGKMIVTPDR